MGFFLFPEGPGLSGTSVLETGIPEGTSGSFPSPLGQPPRGHPLPGGRCLAKGLLGWADLGPSDFGVLGGK